MNLTYCICKYIWLNVFCLFTTSGQEITNLNVIFNPSPPVFNQSLQVTANYKIKKNYYLSEIQLIADENIILFNFDRKAAGLPGIKECSPNWNLDCQNSTILNTSTTVEFVSLVYNISNYKFRWELILKEQTDDLNRLKWKIDFQIEQPYKVGPETQIFNVIFNPTQLMFNQSLQVTAHYRIKNNYYLNKIQLTIDKDIIVLYQFYRTNNGNLGRKECSPDWNLDCKSSVTENSSTTVVFISLVPNISDYKFRWELISRHQNDDLDSMRSVYDFKIDLNKVGLANVVPIAAGVIAGLTLLLVFAIVIIYNRKTKNKNQAQNKKSSVKNQKYIFSKI